MAIQLEGLFYRGSRQEGSSALPFA